jgi:hypothetical protein
MPHKEKIPLPPRADAEVALFTNARTGTSRALAAGEP